MFDVGANSSLVLHVSFVIGYAVLAQAVQIARVSPSPVGDASRMVRHNAYVDSKVRQVAVNVLNHQDYHQRNVIFPSSASIFPSFVSNLSTATALLSDMGIQLQPTSTIPFFPSLPFSRNESFGTILFTTSSVLASVVPSLLQPALNSPPSNLSDTVSSTSQFFLTSQVPQTIASISALTTNGTFRYTSGGATGPTFTNNRYNSSVVPSIGRSVPAAVVSSYLSIYTIADSLSPKMPLKAMVGNDWDNSTDAACTASLNTLGGVSSNPSGISACYNIRRLDNSTGAFNADLRLYRIAPPNGDWTQLRSEGVVIGMAYPDATVTMQKLAKRRDLIEFQGPAVHAVNSKLGIRANNPSPKLLQGLSFLGQVHNGSVQSLKYEMIALDLLTPKINLASTARNGTSISVQLSLQDASFLNGLFVETTVDKVETSTTIIGSREWLSQANRFSSFPTSLVMAAVWGSLLFAIQGYEFLEKVKCRNEDRKRMMAGASGGPVER